MAALEITALEWTGVYKAWTANRNSVEVVSR